MREYLETFFRRKWLFFLPFLAVLAVAVAGGLYSVWQYEVQARLEVRTNPVLDKAGDQLSMQAADIKDEYGRLGDLLMTDDFMKRIIKEVPALKAKAETPTDMDDQVARLRKELVAWAPGQSLITVRYQARDPQVAQMVVSKTIDLFVAQRYSDRVGEAEKTIAFLDSQIVSYQQRLETASVNLSAWEKAHPPAERAGLDESQQLEFQRLRTTYQTNLDQLQYLNSEREKAAFTKARAESQQSSTYLIVDPPVVPQGVNISLNKLLGLVFVGLAVALGLGITVIALATWFSRQPATSTTALPSWLDRLTAPEEQTA